MNLENRIKNLKESLNQKNLVSNDDIREVYMCNNQYDSFVEKQGEELKIIKEDIVERTILLIGKKCCDLTYYYIFNEEDTIYICPKLLNNRLLKHSVVHYNCLNEQIIPYIKVNLRSRTCELVNYDDEKSITYNFILKVVSNLCDILELREVK